MQYLIPVIALQAIYIFHLHRRLRAKDETIFKVSSRSNIKNKRIQEYATQIYNLKQELERDSLPEQLH